MEKQYNAIAQRMAKKGDPNARKIALLDIPKNERELFACDTIGAIALETRGDYFLDVATSNVRLLTVQVENGQANVPAWLTDSGEFAVDNFGVIYGRDKGDFFITDLIKEARPVQGDLVSLLVPQRMITHNNRVCVLQGLTQENDTLFEDVVPVAHKNGNEYHALPGIPFVVHINDTVQAYWPIRARWLGPRRDVAWAENERIYRVIPGDQGLVGLLNANPQTRTAIREHHEELFRAYMHARIGANLEDVREALEHYRHAETYGTNKQLHEKIMACEAFIAESIQQFLSMAEKKVEEGVCDSAVHEKYLQPIIAVSSEANSVLGQLCMLEHNYEKARNHFQNALAINDCPVYQLQLLQARKQLQEAIAEKDVCRFSKSANITREDANNLINAKPYLTRALASTQ